MKTQKLEKKSFGITGSTFKIIACITMLIDHIGAVILERYLLTPHGSLDATILTIDIILRRIGRLGFPMFCFLLIEGFLHTKNKRKYATRLLLFGIISEIPFNLAVTGDLWNRNYQNVFFTLFIGLGLISLIYLLETRFTKLWMRIIGGVIVSLGLAFAELLNTDYGGWGVLTIVGMYLMKDNKLYRMLTGCAILTYYNLVEYTSFLALIPVKFYNGQKGTSFKYAFYVFYPAHLLILYGISVWLGLA